MSFTFLTPPLDVSFGVATFISRLLLTAEVDRTVSCSAGPTVNPILINGVRGDGTRSICLHESEAATIVALLIVGRPTHADGRSNNVTNSLNPTLKCLGAVNNGIDVKTGVVSGCPRKASDVLLEEGVIFPKLFGRFKVPEISKGCVRRNVEILQDVKAGIKTGGVPHTVSNTFKERRVEFEGSSCLPC